jgi:hypothetical protein
MSGKSRVDRVDSSRQLILDFNSYLGMVEKNLKKNEHEAVAAYKKLCSVYEKLKKSAISLDAKQLLYLKVLEADKKLKDRILELESRSSLLNKRYDKLKVLNKSVGMGLSVLALIAFVFSMLFLIDSGITGLVVFGSGDNATDVIDVNFSQSGLYEWHPASSGYLTSLSVTGVLYGDSGSVKLDDYVIYSSASSVPSVEISGTSDGYFTLELGYGNGSYDMNDDGNAYISDLVDFSVGVVDMDSSLNSSNLCTKYIVNNLEDNTSVASCYGASDCCTFLNLDSLGSYDDNFTLNYGKLGASYNNTVSAQLVYYDVNISVPYSNVYNSYVHTLPATFYDSIPFSYECVDSCSLDYFDDSSYDLTILVDGMLAISNISYTISEEEGEVIDYLSVSTSKSGSYLNVSFNVSDSGNLTLGCVDCSYTEMLNDDVNSSDDLTIESLYCGSSVLFDRSTNYSSSSVIYRIGAGFDLGFSQILNSSYNVVNVIVPNYSCNVTSYFVTNLVLDNSLVQSVSFGEYSENSTYVKSSFFGDVGTADAQAGATEINITGTGNDLNSTYGLINDNITFNKITRNVYEYLLPVNIYGDMVFEVNESGFGFNDGYGTNPCTTGEDAGAGWTTLRITEPINVFGSLTIEPGVVLKFDNDSYIQAKQNGKIKSIGNVTGDTRCWVTYTSTHDNLTGYGYTESDGKAYAGVYENAIILDVDASNFSSIEFSRFYYANTSINVSVPRMNYSQSSTAPYGIRNGDIINNQFKESVVGILLGTPINVTNNLFYGIYDYGIKVLSSVSSGLYISYNTFDNCGATGYGADYLGACGAGIGYGITFNGTGSGGGYGNLFVNLNHSFWNDTGINKDYNAYYNNDEDTDKGGNAVALATDPFDTSANHSYFILGSSASTDAGSDTVGTLGFSTYYTGNELDLGTADIGYHYSFTADSGVAVSFVSPTPTWSQNHTGWGVDYIINCSATTIALNDLDNISFYDTTGDYVGTEIVSGQVGSANWTITNLQAGTRTVTCQACDNVTCANSTKTLTTGLWQDMSLSLSDASFIGEDPNDFSGTSVSYAGDVNGDGYDDVIIGARQADDGVTYHAGQSYLVFGGTGLIQDMDLSDADASFIGENGDDFSGQSVSYAGDVNGDGYDDIIIGADRNEDGGYPWAGKSYLIYGGTGLTQDMNLGNANASFIGENAADFSGISVSYAGDVNGDGYDDIIIGAHRNDEGGDYAGQSYLIFGGTGLTQDMDLSNANASFIGEAGGDYAGDSVSYAGDVNGDGYDDLIIGAPNNDDGTNGAGQSYLIYGGTGLTQDMDLSNANASFIGENAFDASGSSVSYAGDVNGDGYDDLIIGAVANDDGGDDAGQSYLIYGGTGLTQDMDLSNADASFIGEDVRDYSSRSVSYAGDVNGDGYDDLIIGADGYDDGANWGAGKSYLIYGGTGLTQDMDLGNANASFIGEDPNDVSGPSVSYAGDVNGDGYDDIIIGAYGDDDGGSSAGQSYLIQGDNSGIKTFTQSSLKVTNSSDYSGGVSQGTVSYIGSGDLNVGGINSKLYINLTGNGGSATVADRLSVLITSENSNKKLDVFLTETGVNTNEYHGEFLVRTGATSFSGQKKLRVLEEDNIYLTLDVNEDTNPPQFSNVLTNLTNETDKSEQVYFNITLTDNIEGSHYIFSYYNSTDWVNDSTTAWSSPTSVSVVKNVSVWEGIIIGKWYANDTNNIWSNTQSQVTVYTFAPNTTAVSILTDTLGNLSSEDLKCYATVVDLDNVTVEVNYTWYNNGVFDSAGVKTGVSNGSSTLINTLASSNTAGGEEWTCSVIAIDGNANEDDWNNASVTVISEGPEVNSVVLNASSVNNYSSDNLTGYVNYTAASDPNVTLAYNWYKDDVLNASSLITDGLVGYWPLNNDTNDYYGSNDGTNYGAVQNKTSYAIGGAYGFDGNDYIDLNDVDIDGNGTISAWIYWIDSGAGWDPIIARSNSAGDSKYFDVSLYIDTTDSDKLKARIGDGSLYDVPNSGIVITTNVWHHVSISIVGGSTATFYVDGVSSQQAITKSPVGNSYDYTIGRLGEYTSAHYYKGLIDEVQIFNRSLSATEINQLYWAGVAKGHTMNSSQTTKGDNWTLGVKAGDSSAWSSEVNSSELSVLNYIPSVSVSLNTTSAGNYTTDNLTGQVSVTDLDNDAVYNITDWRLNGASVAVLNMPFDSSSNSTYTADYSTYSNNGVVSGATYNSSCNSGYDGSACYEFGGVNDMIDVGNSNNLDFEGAGNDFSVSTWVKGTETLAGGAGTQIIGKGDGYAQDSGWKIIQFEYSGSNYYQFKIGNGGSSATASKSKTDNNWHLLTGVKTEDYISLYFDGVLIQNNPHSIDIASTSTNLYLGRKGSSATEYFQGSIDQVQIFNRALSSSEVLNLYNGTRTNFVSNETNKGELWSMCVTPDDLSDVGSTVCSSNVTVLNTVPLVSSVVLNSTSVNNLTSDNLTGYVASSDDDSDNLTYAYNWYKNGTLNASSLITDGLVAYYPLNNDTLDYYGGNDGVNYGAVQNKTSYAIGGSYSFDGVNDHITITSSSLANGLESADVFTLSSWFKMDDINNLNTIFANWYTGSPQVVLRYDGDTDNTIEYYLYESDAGTAGPARSSSLLQDTWYHIVANANGTNLLLYINNKLVDSNDVYDGTIAGGDNSFEIGSSDALNAGWMNGTIDEIQIWNRSLNATEVSQLYWAGVAGGHTMNSSQTTVGDNWTLGVRPLDYQDLGSEVNSSSVLILAILDTTTPNSSNYVYNDTTPEYGEVLQFNASFVDETAMDSWIFSHNLSGVWQNMTASSVWVSTGGYNVSQYNLTINLTGNSTVGWAFWGNDTSNNWNYTGIQSFVVNITRSPVYNWAEEAQKIQASDKAASDYFGFSSSISGDYAIVGARYEDTGGSNAGAAYIFERNSTGSWNEVNKIQASDIQANDYFGFSVSISGNYSIVGARGEDTGGSSAGAAYVFERNASGSWNEVNKLVASDAVALDLFGKSSSISGDYAIVGTNAAGTAYVFERNATGSWNEEQILTRDGYVAIDGDYALAGGYVFERNATGSWNEIQLLITGTSSSISGNYSVIGGGEVVYFFERNATGNWNEVTVTNSSDWQASDQFGYSSSISANYAIVGARYEDTGGSNAGAAYIFERNATGSWNELRKIQASDKEADDYFGYSSSISGNYTIVGAAYEDTGGSAAGAAYIFNLIDIVVVQISSPTEGQTITTSTFDLNYTVIPMSTPGSGTLDKCWHDYGETNATNSTPVSAGINFTINNRLLYNGSNTWTVYCNDTDGVEGSDNVIFEVDVMEIDSPPASQVITTPTFDLNYSVYATSLDKCWNSPDEGVTNSSTVVAGNNFTLNHIDYSAGDYNWTVYCNDTFGDESLESIGFTLNPQTTVTLLTPLTNITAKNQSWFEVTAEINCTAGDCGWVNVTLDPLIGSGTVMNAPSIPFAYDFGTSAALPGVDTTDYIAWDDGPLADTCTLITGLFEVNGWQVNIGGSTPAVGNSFSVYDTEAECLLHFDPTEKQDGIIPTGSGSPFYTNKSTNPVTINLGNSSQPAQNVTFWVKANVTLLGVYENFFIYTTTLNVSSEDDESSYFDVVVKTLDTTAVSVSTGTLQNLSTEDLNCYATVVDSVNTTVYVNYTWYKNGVLDSSGQTTGVSNGSSTLINTIGFASTSIGENWTCSVLAYDGSFYEDNWNNATITILETPDTTTPNSTNYVKNATTVKYDDTVAFNTSFIDDTAMSSWIFSHNLSGIWQNMSASSVFISTGGYSVAQYNVTINLTRGETVGWAFFGNDSSNNWNYTGIQSFVVNNSAPNVSSVILNSTDVSTNDTNQNLTGYVVASDSDSDNITYAYNWYKNGTLNATSLITDGLISYYPLNNDTLDYYGGNDGVDNNFDGDELISGKIGNVYELDGIDDWINITGFAFSGTEFALSLWVYPKEVSNTIVVKTYAHDTDRDFYIDNAGASGYVRVYFGESNANGYVSYNEGFNLNEWNHFTLIFDSGQVIATDRIRSYLNGNRITSIAGSSYPSQDDVMTFDVSRPVGIGARNIGVTPSAFLNGSVDELMIYNKSLTESEISQLYWAGVAKGHTMNSSQTTAGDEWKLGVKALDYSSIGNEVNSSGVLIINGVPSVSSVVLNSTDVSTNDSNQNLTGYVTASDSDSDNITYAYNWYKNGTLNATSLITDGLVSYWPLNNDTFDYSGANDGVDNGAVQNKTNYIIGGAYTFDGVDDHILIGANVFSNPTEATMAAWFKSESDASMTVFTIENGFGLFLGMSTAGKIVACFDGSCSSDTKLGSNLNDGNWHHFVATNVASKTDTYIDGVKLENDKSESMYNIEGLDRTSTIGSSYTGSGGNFNGTIDEVMYLTRALTSSEVSQLYWAGVNNGHTMNSSQTTAGDNWTLGVKGLDYSSIGTEVNSSDLLVQAVVVPDVTTPNITSLVVSPVNNSVNSTNLYQFNASVVDETAISSVILHLDGYDYAVSDNVGSTYMINLSNLSSWDYDYYWFANDTSGNINQTEWYSYMRKQKSYNSTVYYNSTAIAFNLSFEVADSALYGVDDYNCSNGSVSCDAGINLNNSNLISYWSLDDKFGSNNTADKKSNNHGTIGGNPTNSSGLSSKAMRFDGVDDYISIADDSSLDLVDDFTIGAWIKWEGGTGHIVTKHTYGVGSGWRFVVRSGGQLALESWSGFAESISTATIPSEGSWTYVMATFVDSTDEVNLYINGVGESMTDSHSNSPNSEAVMIGRHVNSPEAYFFNGSIDEVLIYNRSLNVSEVNDLYKVGLSQHGNANVTLKTRTASSYNISDSGLVEIFGFNNDNSTIAFGEKGTINGTKVGGLNDATESDGIVGKGYHFERNNDYINLGNDSAINLNTFTYSMWVWRTTPTDSINQLITRNAGYSGWSLYAVGNHASICSGIDGTLQIRDDASSIGCSTKIIPFEQWSHVTFVATPTTYDAYIDGENVLTGTWTMNPKYDLDVLIGIRNDNNFEWEGSLDEYRLYNRTLSQPEIQNLYNLGSYHINWSDWTDQGKANDSDVIEISDANFVQYQAEFSSDNTESVAYLINESVVRGGEVVVDVISPNSTNYVYNDSAPKYGSVVSFNASFVDENAMSQWIFSHNLSGSFVNSSASSSWLSSGAQSVAQYNLTINLTRGSTVGWAFWGNDTSGNWNYTGIQSFVVNNSAPNVSSVVLNSTNISTNDSNQNLTGYITTTDIDSDLVYNITDWRVNGSSWNVLNMPFDSDSNSTNTSDYSTYRNDGNITGGVYNASCNSGYDGSGCYEFDGVMHGIVLGDSPDLEIGTNDQTACAWIRHPTSQQDSYSGVFYGSIYGRGHLTEDDGFGIYLYNDVPTVGISNEGGDEYIIKSNVDTKDGLWHHVCASADRDVNMSIYVDGIKKNTTNISSLDGFNLWESTNILIGSRDHSSGAAFDFKGQIDQVQVWNKTLSSEQILELYNGSRTKLVSNETTAGNLYSMCVTPDDLSDVGSEICSSEVTILAEPTVCPEWAPLNYESGCMLNTTYTVSDGEVLSSVENIWIGSAGSIINISTINNHGTSVVVNISGNLTILSGGNITAGNITLNIENLNVTDGGIINTNSLGYTAGYGLGAAANCGMGCSAPGASHGGYGGKTTSIESAQLYGDSSSPIEFGSGGSQGTRATGGQGGGIVKIIAQDTVDIVGTIEVDGNKGYRTFDNRGGGSGGSIWIIAQTFSGSGSISAKGGPGSVSCTTNDGGAGGGGRISLVNVSNYEYTGNLYVEGGQLNSGGGISVLRGFAGTIAFPEYLLQNFTLTNSLTIGNNLSYAFGNLTILNGGSLMLDGNPYSNPSDSASLTKNYYGSGGSITADILNIAAGGSISVVELGFSKDFGYGTTIKPGDNGGTGGAGYGGLGGNSTTTGGEKYGDFLEPAYLGSGPGSICNIDSPSGAGAIKINANTLIIDGTINASGSIGTSGVGDYSGGSSGGSIWIISDNVSGSGDILLNGGNGQGGGGAGGRSHIQAGAISLTGTIGASGGTGNYDGGNSGQNGTIVIEFQDTIDISSATFNSPFMIARNNSFGRIVYNDVTQTTNNSIDFQNLINITINNITVSSDANSDLNTSAELTLYNTDSFGLSSRAPYRNGALCSSAICTELTDADTYVFNVTQFTSYSIGEGNFAPNTTLVVLNSTALTNYSDDNLTCYANVEDTDGDTLTINYTWYKDNIENISGITAGITQNVTSLISTLDSINTTFGDDWTCSVQAYDGSVYEGDWNNASDNITILNKLPNTTTVSISANQNYTNETLSCYATVDDDTLVSVNYTWFNNSVEITSGQVASVSPSVSTLITTMGYGSTSVGDNWTCSVQAYDSYVYEGDWNNVTMLIINAPPSSSSRIDPQSPSLAYTNDTLLGYCNSSDIESDNVTYYYKWYKDGTLNVSSIYNVSGPPANEINVYNITSDLTLKSEEWKLSCKANDGLLNSTWSTNVSVSIENTRPNTEELIINSSLLTNLSNEDISCYATISDANLDNVSGNYTWYKNGVENFSGQGDSFTQGTLNLITTLSNVNTSVNDNWTCSVVAYDGEGYELDWNNVTLNVLSTPPVTVSANINNTVAYTNETLYGYCNATDEEGDDIDYNYRWYWNGNLQLSGTSTGFANAVESNVANLTSGNTTKGQNWSLSCLAVGDTSWYNDSIIISNSEINISLVEITDNGLAYDRYELTPIAGTTADASIRVRVKDIDGATNQSIIAYICNLDTFEGCSIDNYSYSKTLSYIEDISSTEFYYGFNGSSEMPYFWELGGLWKMIVNATDEGFNSQNLTNFTYGTVRSINYSTNVTLGGEYISIGTWNNGTTAYIATNWGNLNLSMNWSASDFVGPNMTWVLNNTDFGIDDDISIDDDTDNLALVYLNATPKEFTPNMVVCNSSVCDNTNASTNTYFHIHPPANLSVGTYNTTMTITIS